MNSLDDQRKKGKNRYSHAIHQHGHRKTDVHGKIRRINSKNHVITSPSATAVLAGEEEEEDEGGKLDMLRVIL